MGPVGTQQDAAFALRASVPAGNYHVICDAVITGSVDVNFALIWRRPGLDTTLAAWSKHWEPRGGGNFDAQPYEVDMAARAIDFLPGDLLVFRYAGAGTMGTTSGEPFVPNGDGPNSNGRIPSVTLPR